MTIWRIQFFLMWDLAFVRAAMPRAMEVKETTPLDKGGWLIVQKYFPYNKEVRRPRG